MRGFNIVQPIMFTSIDEKKSFYYTIYNITKKQNQIQLLGF